MSVNREMDNFAGGPAGEILPPGERLKEEMRRRETAESGLKVASERLSLAMSAANLVLWDYDIAAGMIYLSKEWAEITGEQAKEAISLRADQLQTWVHPDDVEPMLSQIKATLKGLQPIYRVDQRVKNAQGGWRWIHSHGRITQRDAAGRALRATGINVDIDERKRAEEALREAMQSLAQTEQRLRAMTNGVPGAVYQFQWAQGMRPRVLFMSAGVADLIGLDRAQIEREPDLVFRVTFDEDRPGFIASLNEATAQKATHWSREFRIRRGDGAVRWTRSEASRMGHGAEAVWNGYWVDITAQREFEAKLNEAKLAADSANRAKSAFLAVTSHEIRTPMNAIMGMLELLDLSKLDPEQGKMVAIANDAANTLLGIINDILDVSKIEAGQMALLPEPTSLAKAIGSVIGTLTNGAERKGLVLGKTLDAALAPALILDPLRLKQILFNLIGNAIKFTERGRIDVRARLVEDKGESQVLRIEIQDSGIGMRAEDQARLFQPFVQAEADTTRRFGGSGLGLTISKRLAEMMGGTLSLSSVAGQGTTMTLELDCPVASANDLETVPDPTRGHKEAMGALKRESVSVHTGPVRILVAEDNPVNQAVLRRQLAALDMDADFANNGELALQKLGEGDYALVLCDCQMPVMDGYTFARKLREAEARDPSRKRMPVIACTANAMRGEDEGCYAAGMDDVLSKPVSLAALKRILLAWVPVGNIASATIEPADAPAVVSGNTPMNRERFRQIVNGDLELERELLLMIRARHPDDSRRLQTAIGENQWQQAAQEAHRMKGTAQTLAADALAAVCERIETAAGEGDAAAVLRAKPDLERESRRLVEFLRGLEL
jgi:PAS domain S-box-containing protein